VYIRPFKVRIGVGAGPDAGTFETIMDLPEYRGPFISQAADAQRTAEFNAYLLARLSPRFPGEKLRVIEAIPRGNRQRFAWDR
jgi:hypothetical protein